MRKSLFGVCRFEFRGCRTSAVVSCVTLVTRLVMKHGRLTDRRWREKISHYCQLQHTRRFLLCFFVLFFMPRRSTGVGTHRPQ